MIPNKQTKSGADTYHSTIHLINDQLKCLPPTHSAQGAVNGGLNLIYFP